jgi:hypothetical protein
MRLKSFKTIENRLHICSEITNGLLNNCYALTDEITEGQFVSSFNQSQHFELIQCLVQRGDS